MTQILSPTELARKIALLDQIEGTFVHRQGTAAEINAIILAPGELAFTTDTSEIRRGDGATPGGVFVSGLGSHYANFRQSTPDANYVNLISAPVPSVGTWEYLAFIYCDLGTAFTGNLTWSSGTLLQDEIVDSEAIPGFPIGPSSWSRRRLCFSNNSSADEMRSWYFWNVVPTTTWGPDGLINEVSFGQASGGHYQCVEYSGVFQNSTDPTRELVLKARTPGGGENRGIRSSMMVRRIK
jgi:hypothetical protein